MQDQACDCGNPNETPEHFFFDCPKYRQPRNKLLNSLRETTNLFTRPMTNIKNTDNGMIEYLTSADIASALLIAENIQTYIQETN